MKIKGEICVRHGDLKKSLRRGHKIEFDESRILEVLYRPFTKLWLYEDDRILSSVKTVSRMFGKNGGGVGDPYHRHQQPDRLHPDGNRVAPGSLRGRNKPAVPSYPPRRTILITAPTNRTIFEVMITQLLTGLHALDPSTRLLPRS